MLPPDGEMGSSIQNRVRRRADPKSEFMFFELMLYLGVSRDTIYDWLASRHLPGHRVGRLWKFKQDEADE